MDHNGLYTDLDSFASITNCGTTNNSFNDTSTLPSLNNFKYQQTNLSTNIYQQPVQTLHDLTQQQQHNHTTTKSSSNNLPQTQININNCNNNIFFPHDDGIFDANTTSTCASATNSGNNNHTNSNNQSQKNNFIGYVRKELGTIGGGGGGGGGDNITYNINNINTNIVNNINNPTSLVNGSDIFGGNQYHQINKNGETIINFTNNNLNSTGTASMPSDTVSATSQNYYGYQSNNGQGQQTVYESSVQSQSQSQSSSFLDPGLSATTKSGNSMGTSGAGHYHGHHNQTVANGSFQPGNANTIPPEHTTTSLDPFSEYPDTLSTAKIINNFESKNPLKYQTSNRVAAGTYYKTSTEYPTHQYHPSSHLPPHNYSSLYQPTNGPTVPKMPPTHGYEPYPRPSRNPAQHYTMQHYGNPGSVHAMEEHAGSRLGYSRTSSVPVHASYHHPHNLPHPPPQSNYGNYYTNGYGGMAYPVYPQMQPSPYGSPMMRSESCTKAATNYNKTGAVATLSPVEHSSYSLPHGVNYPAQKKDFYNESHYYPPPHPYYDETVNSALNSCAKKTSSRAKVSGDIYNPNGATTMYPDHRTMVAHHQQNGNVMRNVNVGYQPMPKHYTGGNSYPMPTNSCDLANPYHNFNYLYKGGEHPKMPPKINPTLSSKQFKSYGHFEPLPHPHMSYGHPQYHTMQAKHPEKIKISIDLEEQINSSKIPKLRDAPHPSYGFDPHHPHHYYQYHHHIPSRNVVNDNDPKNSIANINISLRDFLSTWNDEEDEAGGERRPAGNGALEDLSEHMERTIMREYNPMFVQKATDSFINASDVPSTNSVKSQLSDLETGIINEGTEKLYVLESIDVPLSELNKYKHLNVINKLPENVVINDKEFGDVDSSMKFIEEIDLPREKLYKSEFELEFEACQERKLSKPIDEPEVAKDQKEVVAEVKAEVVAVDESKNDDEGKVSDESSTKKKSLKVKSSKIKSEELKVPKVLKMKKEKILKVSSSKDPRKARITKRVKKYSLNQRTSSVKSLQSTCVDFLNTSGYRNYAREQNKIITKFSKMRVLNDFKKKFNFGAKKLNPAINQKLNHSVRINSLREICGNLLKDKSRMLEINNEDDEDEMIQSENENSFPTLMQLSRQVLSEMDIDVVENEYLYSPLSLKELCETFIYSNSQYFLIEEVSNVPKLQDLCKNVLSETNIFINLDEVTLSDEPEEALEGSSVDEPIYFVEENSGNIGELFESENLNSFEKSEILRKIQRVANIEDDDEIIRAIGALHRGDDDVESINNNNSNVSNKNISCANENFSDANEFSMVNEVMKFDSELSFLSYMDDDLMHAVQYEEIISLNNEDGKASKKVVEILRHKYLNRSEVRQASKTIRSILRKSLTFQQTKKLQNAKRREQINALKEQARAALSKWKELDDCDNRNSDGKSSSETSSSSSSSHQESDKESQNYAKDDKQAQSHQKPLIHEPAMIIEDFKAVVDDERCFDAQAELTLPKLPAVFPSINEYKIDRKSSNQNDVKDIYDAKRRKLTFDESLLSIEKIYNQNNCEENRHQHHERKKSSSRSHHRSSSSSAQRHDRHQTSKNGHRSRSRDSDKRSHHNSSRHNNYYNRDQMKHSEAKRLVLPSYKLYDKDLDVKLKIMPFVRIEREERVDDLVKQYN